jgi:hypothetical protein
MSRNITPTRQHTPEEKRVREVMLDTQGRIQTLSKELRLHERFIGDMRELCAHDWHGQDDVHPHGTPSETFICTICEKEENR